MALNRNSGMSQTWPYRLEKHKVQYGAILFTLGAIVVGIAGHDYDIVRGIAQGYYDLNAAHDLYLNISNPSMLDAIWILGLLMILGAIVYMVMVGLAHRRIAKDRFPL